MPIRLVRGCVLARRGRAARRAPRPRYRAGGQVERRRSMRIDAGTVWSSSSSSVSAPITSSIAASSAVDGPMWRRAKLVVDAGQPVAGGDRVRSCWLLQCASVV